ncbi:hypothetical protein KAR91_16005 [Candidatus Pacearchaeota archaeon]|nr:hypothetical protein [Candidatus Pacearchaeota archaeon]
MNISIKKAEELSTLLTVCRILTNIKIVGHKPQSEYPAAVQSALIHMLDIMLPSNLTLGDFNMIVKRAEAKYNNLDHAPNCKVAITAIFADGLKSIEESYPSHTDAIKQMKVVYEFWLGF